MVSNGVRVCNREPSPAPSVSAAFSFSRFAFFEDEDAVAVFSSDVPKKKDEMRSERWGKQGSWQNDKKGLGEGGEGREERDSGDGKEGD